VGLYPSEEEAHKAYVEALSNMNTVVSAPRRQHKGYRYVSTLKKWVVRLQVKGKRIYVGYYETEREALNAYQEAKNNV
jgi:hypothetical protein